MLISKCIVLSQILLALNSKHAHGQRCRERRKITCGGKRYRSALGVYLGTSSTDNDALDTAPRNLFGHLGPNLVEHDTLLVEWHATPVELKLRSVNDGESRPQLGVQAQGLRAGQAQESFCAIDFR